MSKAVKSVTGAVGGVASSIFGSGSSSPGFAGTGTFRSGGKYDPNKESFKVRDLGKKLETVGKEAESAKSREETSVQQRQDLIKRLEEQSKGEGPSLAKAQLRAATDRNLAQQLGTAAAQRGGSASSRQRQLARAQAAGGRDVAQAATVARMAEQQQAQQLLASEVGDELALASQLRGKYLQMGFNLDAADLKAKQELEALRTGTQLSQNQLALQAFEGSAGRRSQMFGQGAQAAAMAAMSDKRQKKKIKKVKSNDMAKALQTISDEEEKKNKSKLNSFGDNDSSKESSSFDSLGKALSVGQGARNIKAQKPDTGSKESSGPSPQMMAAMSQASAASDENEKQNKKDFNPKDFLDKLKAYSYEYKNPNMPGAGEGTHVSVMAQDLEKAGPIGKSMIMENEDGVKMVDYGKGFGAILAAQAHLNERLSTIEGKKSKKKKR